MIRPGDYEDRSIFVDRGRLWRPKVGASDGVIEEVPPPWVDRLLLRWLPSVALRRAQARAAVRRLAQQLDEPPGTCRIQRLDPTTQRWEPDGSLRPSPWLAHRRRG